MTSRVNTFGWTLGFILICATVHADKNPAIPELRVKPGDGAEHPSPPPLKGESRNATLSVTPTTEPGTVLDLTVEGAIVMALEHNQSLLVEEVNPAIQETLVSEQRAAFDPVLLGGYTRTNDRLERDLRVTATTSLPDISGTGNITVKEPVETIAKTKTDDLSASVTEHLPTGTDISVTFGKAEISARNTTSNLNLARGVNTDSESPDLSLKVTQSLLRGGGLGVNLASISQARISERASQYELRGVAESLVSQVEQTYWDYVLAQRKIVIFEQSVLVAQSQLDEVEERIRIGKLAESERAGAQAEVAQRKSSLIDARGTLATTRLALLRLLNPDGAALRNTEIHLTSDPSTPEIPLSGVEDSVALAQRMRPDLNQARLLTMSDDLEIVKTKNGLLPQLDVFLTLAKDMNTTSYAQSFLVATEDRKDHRYTTQAGATFSYPIGNRAARARDRRAKFTRERDFRALANMTQLVEQDVRGAYVEVGRAHEQIAATSATRRLQEETLQAETEKFRVGKSTVLLVAQAQRDLLTAQINEVQARTTYLKAIVNLYRLEGSLLERRGVECPGRDPVELASGPAMRGALSAIAAPETSPSMK